LSSKENKATKGDERHSFMLLILGERVNLIWSALASGL